MGFRFWVLGFGLGLVARGLMSEVWGLGYGVLGLGLRRGVWGLEFRVWRLGAGGGGLGDRGFGIGRRVGGYPRLNEPHVS